MLKRKNLSNQVKTLLVGFGLMYGSLLQATDVTFPIILEAENAELHGDLKVKSLVGFSNGAYIGDFNDSSGAYLRLLDVEVPTEGTYQFDIYYVCMERRSMFIKVDKYVPSVVQIQEETQDWNRPPTGVLSSSIYLNKGKNTIKIGCFNGSGPNIDKFELLETTRIIEKPLEEKAVFSYDLTDNADIFPTVENASFSFLTDNDETTLYALPGATTTQVVVDCKTPVLLTGYLLSAGNGSSQNLANWKVEYSKDRKVWMRITPNASNDLVGSTLFSINRDPSTAQIFAAPYYRITALGNVDVQIAEIQLFGCPFTANVDGKSFPVDMTEGMNKEFQTFADPSGNFLQPLDERYFNLFNRDLSSKYFQGDANQFFVQYEPTNAQKLDYYTLTSCRDFPDRDPKTWVLEGYLTGTWETIDEVSNFKFPCRFATMRFDVAAEKEYLGYRLSMLENNGSSSFQLLKWQLFGENASTDLSKKSMDGVSVLSSNGAIRFDLSLSEPLSYEVFDVAGKRVGNGMLTSGKQISIKSGVYFVRLSSKKTSKITKVFVQ